MDQSACNVIQRMFSLLTACCCLSRSESSSVKRKPEAKVMRKWADSKLSKNDMAALDFSAPAPDSSLASAAELEGLVDESSMGGRDEHGMYTVADLEAEESDGEEEGFDFSNLSIAPKKVEAGVFSSFFSRLTGTNPLTKADLAPVLDAMREHLMKKNVAKDIADKLCDNVEVNLVGKKLGSFSSKFHVSVL